VRAGGARRATRLTLLTPCGVNRTFLSWEFQDLEAEAAISRARRARTGRSRRARRSRGRGVGRLTVAGGTRRFGILASLGPLALAFAAVLGRLALEAVLLGAALTFSAVGSAARTRSSHVVVLGLHVSLILGGDSHLGILLVNGRQALNSLSITGKLVHKLAIVVDANALGAVDGTPAQVQLLAGALDDARVNAALSLDPRLTAISRARFATPLADRADSHANRLLAQIFDAD
jgi:hypothetical protein